MGLKMKCITVALIITAISLTLTGFLATGSMLQEASGDNAVLSSLQTMKINTVEHDNIYIDGNADFLSQASEEGWSGSGNPGDPIIITGLKIGHSLTYNVKHAIEVYNTDLYFRISNNIAYASYYSRQT
ncbi:MAG: hypothetical protein ACTSP4_14390 [Candidatus Hodarchaeales archaeon]